MGVGRIGLDGGSVTMCLLGCVGVLGPGASTSTIDALVRS